jgi:hypothetical protein
MSVTERSFYPDIIELVKRIGGKFGVRVTGVSEIPLGRQYPDIMLQLDGYNLLLQVKIDSVEKMLDDLAKTYPLASSCGAGLLLLLFPPEARRIHPVEISSVTPKIRIKRALLLTSWASKHLEEEILEKIFETVASTIKEYEKVKIPIVDYMTIAQVAREAIEELSGAMRSAITQKEMLDQAQAIVGSFDFYKCLLKETVESEEIMNTYIADIVAYITVISLLFLHVASIKRYGMSILPHIDNPLSPPKDLLDITYRNMMRSPLYKDYQFIAEPFLYILKLLENAAGVEYTLTRYLYAIQALRPEHVKGELFGRIYQEGLPPETRKNLGAFFTNPVAARLLAYLAVENYDEKVLDPACGSGTLLASAYEAKMEKALQYGLSRSEAHKLFLEEQVVGIDIMQFAKELTSINLALQDVETPTEPKVYWGDGIEKMKLAVPKLNEDPPRQPLLEEYIERDREKYLKQKLQREGFDLVIMNPPFTRRERIPENERKELNRMLGEIVRGKVGYWAYFFAAADNVIKLGGKLASVTPEEFFAGRSAESIRRYLLRGEVMKSGKWTRALERIYIPEIIIKSAVDVAFSEEALYRDYLVVFRKKHEEKLRDVDKFVIVILKKKLEELKDREKDLVMQIRNLMQGSNIVDNEFFDAIVLKPISSFIEEFIDNMKPLVTFNTVKSYELYQQIRSVRGLKRLDEVALLRDYTAQYTGKGFEEYVRRLFISKYETRAPTISFKLISENVDSVNVGIKGEEKTFNIPKKALVCSLRTYANIKSIDITGKEEYAIVKPETINKEYLKLGGLIDEEKLSKASKDIERAYDDIAGNILLVRRAQLTSPDVYWLAFYSNNKIIGPSAPMICMKLKVEDQKHYKALALYLNSSITFLQLLAYLVMTRGAWVALHGGQVWSNVRIPDIISLPKDVLEEAVQTLDSISKIAESIQSLYVRYASKSDIQRKIDKSALKMIGVDWSDEQLNALYDTIKLELDIMQRILEESQKRRNDAGRRKEGEEEDEEELEPAQRSLYEWMKK